MPVSKNLTLVFLLTFMLFPLPSLGTPTSREQVDEQRTKLRYQYQRFVQAAVGFGICAGVNCPHNGWWCNRCLIGAGLASTIAGYNYEEARKLRDFEVELATDETREWEPDEDWDPPDWDYDSDHRPNLGHSGGLEEFHATLNEEIQDICDGAGCQAGIDSNGAFVLTDSNGNTYSSANPPDPEIINHPDFKKAFKKALENKNPDPKALAIANKLNSLFDDLHPSKESKSKKQSNQKKDPASSFSSTSKQNLNKSLSNSSKPLSKIATLKKEKPTLMKQFRKLKNQKKRNIASSSKKSPFSFFGKDAVGAIDDNIFIMVHKRYQKHRKQKEFIEVNSYGLPI